MSNKEVYHDINSINCRTIFSSICQKSATHYSKNCAIQAEQIVKAAKINPTCGVTSERVIEYLNRRTMVVSRKEPVIDLNIERLMQEGADVTLDKILVQNTSNVEDIDSSMGIYGLSMYSGIPLESFSLLESGFIETPYEKGKCIADTFREFLFKNPCATVNVIKNRFGKSGEIILDSYQNIGMVRVYPLIPGENYKISETYKINESKKILLGMTALEKALHETVDLSK